MQCKDMTKQECIPVGSVPGARRPYPGVCFPGGCTCRGVCTCRGGCTYPGGVYLHGGVLASQHPLRQTPPLWTESHTPVKTLPWPNFVAAGNKSETPIVVDKKRKCVAASAELFKSMPLSDQISIFNTVWWDFIVY